MGNLANMGTIGTINHYLNIFLVGTVLALLIVGALVIYLLKVKKVMAKEETINYDRFERYSSEEFVKFDNIIDIKNGLGDSTFGVMVINEHTFLGMMEIKGYNYYSASAEDKISTNINMVSFFQTIEKPIQLRQTAKAIDISYNVAKQRKVCEELELKGMQLDMDYKETLILSEDYFNNPEIYNEIAETLESLRKEIVTTRWMLEEAKEVLTYMEGFSASGKASKINHLIFSYTYDPNDYVEELTEEEIYIKSSQELANLASNYAHGLGNCGCTCRLLTGKEMMDLTRRHFHPETGDDIRVEDLFDSSYHALFISSDHLLKLMRQKVGENKYKEKLAAMKKSAAENKEHYKENLDKYTDQLSEKLQEMEEEGAFA